MRRGTTLPCCTAMGPLAFGTGCQMTRVSVPHFCINPASRRRASYAIHLFRNGIYLLSRTDSFANPKDEMLAVFATKIVCVKSSVVENALDWRICENKGQ